LADRNETQSRIGELELTEINLPDRDDDPK